ncbi:MFS family permease [Catenulispora sp. MAP5-51]|uniref:MFS transporter n=1 Tax=Catenulispora sp. MAP5-51 TaxID=3156298 RepID=UPI00351360B0
MNDSAPPSDPPGTPTPPDGSPTPATPTPWAPMRDRIFRILWLAQLGSNVGSWMQTVGAQWLLVSHHSSTTLVAAVQTASLLPVMLLSLPAGVMADVLDRRRLLIYLQLAMALVAGVLAWLTAADLTTPTVLLALTFLLGCGQAFVGPAWQAIQPELVPRAQIPAAATLGSLTVNLARAVGPAVAGFLVAASGAALVFAINAVSFLFVVAAVATWHRAPQAGSGHPERALAALRAGNRYMRNAPSPRRILLRAALFVIPGSALWALLPVVASSRLALGAGGYGVLLAALGVGAVIGAFTLSWLTSHLSPNRLLAASALVFAIGTLVLGVTTNKPTVVIVMVPTGVAWLASLSTLNSALQLSLPAWVRARALAVYLLVFMGGQAIGSLLWGALASPLGITTTLVIAAALLAGTALSVRQLPLLALTGKLDRTTDAHWPDPHLVFEPDLDSGPIVVVKRYHVAPADTAEFLQAIDRVGLSRRRTGASRWGVFRDGDEAQTFVELFEVPSWQEHQDQRSIRLTGADSEFEERANRLSEPAPTVQHLLPAQDGGA